MSYQSSGRKDTRRGRRKQVRRAIYTRKSTSEGLESDFNALDAQRDAAEFYVGAMCHEGWEALPNRYDDGGFTGGNIDRPALQRLLADIEAGKIDVVVVYKVDRLSRSLLDFAQLLALFEAKGVGFVSTTPQFNTRDVMGRLTLNIVVSFGPPRDDPARQAQRPPPALPPHRRRQDAARAPRRRPLTTLPRGVPPASVSRFVRARASARSERFTAGRPTTGRRAKPLPRMATFLPKAAIRLAVGPARVSQSRLSRIA